jgi:hypothetical protein
LVKPVPEITMSLDCDSWYCTCPLLLVDLDLDLDGLGDEEATVPSPLHFFPVRSLITALFFACTSNS